MVILIQCKDKVGLVAVIAGLLAKRNINIISMREYVEAETSRFFTRIVLMQDAAPGNLIEELKAALPEDSIIQFNPLPEKRFIVLVTKEYHCLGDILIRNHFKSLSAKVECVIGNHEVLKDICERFDIPFFHVTHQEKNKQQFESALLEVINKFPHDYLVLAKFMRILSPEFVKLFPNRIVNIHHSFLPAFTGAKPYMQANKRGVKIIGATAHFVTNNLDEGPIIEQQVIPVDHTFTTADMVKAGKEIEKSVLAKSLKLLVEDRVFVYNNKTIVFE